MPKKGKKVEEVEELLALNTGKRKDKIPVGIHEVEHIKKDGTKTKILVDAEGNKLNSWGRYRETEEERKERVENDFKEIVRKSKQAFFEDNPAATSVSGRLCAVSPEDETMRALMQRATYESLMFFNAANEAGPVKSDEELCTRLNDFFMACAYAGQFVTIEKMCLAIGQSLTWYRNVLTRAPSAKPFSTETANILEQARLIIQAIDADLVSTGKIQQVSYIFRAKNFYEMSDEAKVNLTVAPAERTTQQLLYGAEALSDGDDSD